MLKFSKFNEQRSQCAKLTVLYECEWIPDRTTIVVCENNGEELIQPWNDSDDPKELSQIHLQAIELAKSVKTFFTRLLGQAAGLGNEVLVNTKPLKSFLDKVINRGRDANKIHDVLRSAVICKTDLDVTKVVSRIRQLFKIAEHEYKEDATEDELGYFGSHHFKVFVPVLDGTKSLIAEIQIMTQKLWRYKSVAHKIYTKLRSGQNVSDEAIFGASLSRLLFRVGNMG